MSERSYPTLSFRVGRVEERVRALEETKPDVLAERVANLADDVKSLKRAFYAFAFSTAGGALAFAFTAFRVFGH